MSDILATARKVWLQPGCKNRLAGIIVVLCLWRWRNYQWTVEKVGKLHLAMLDCAPTFHNHLGAAASVSYFLGEKGKEYFDKWIQKALAAIARNLGIRLLLAN